MSLSYTDTTRYLCSAAYLSKKFRDTVIKQIVKDKYRAIAVSYGVDVVIVIKHCLVAAQRETQRNNLLTILFFFTFINLSYLFLPCLIISYIIVFIDKWNTRYRIIAKKFARNNFQLEPVEFSSNDKIKAILTQISTEENGNVVVYGGFSPFVGSGLEVGAWSFSLNSDIGKEQLGQRLQPIPFSVEELYKDVVDNIEKLNLNGLTIEDKLCVNGKRIRDYQLFLPDMFSRPYSYINPQEIKRFVNSGEESIRYYKHIKVVGWGGELVFSLFLRFYKNHKKLFVEASLFLLTPVQELYQLCDAIEPEISTAKVREILVESLRESFIDFILSPFKQLGKLFETWQENRRIKKIKRIVRETPNFNYGAFISIRELASSGLYSQYFQKLDKEMYMKIIEREIFDALINFLDSKNIDTSELKKRSDIIYNSGLIVSGGSINATNLAVGNEAKSSSN